MKWPKFGTILFSCASIIAGTLGTAEIVGWTPQVPWLLAGALASYLGLVFLIYRLTS